MKSRLHATTAALAVAVGAALPAVSAAQSTGWQMPYERGFWGHAGLSLGGAELDVTCPAGSPCDTKEQAFRAFAGGRFNNAIGGEIGYIRFGDFQRGGGETDIEGIDLALIAGIPFGNNWSVFGKLGGLYSSVDVAGTAPGLLTGKENGWGWRAGLGVQMGITDNWAIRADLDRFRVAAPGGDEDIDTFMLGAQYTFR